MKKHISLSMLLCLSVYGLSGLQAAEVQVGDRTDQVVDVLGKPNGRIVSGENEVWLYENGTVEFASGKASSIELLSGEAFAAKQQKRRQLAEQRRARREALRARGEAEKKKMMANPQYSRHSAGEMVRAWDNFMQRYPGVSIDRVQYNTARIKIREDQAARAAAQRKAESLVEKEDPGPAPKISGKRKRKLMRAGKWKWSEDQEAETP